MTPLQHEPLRTQHYLYLHDPVSAVPAVVGFFPWGKGIIMVGFDGTHPDALELVENHSWARTVEVGIARRWWSQYTDSMPQRPMPYTTTPPANPEVRAQVQTICTGLALRHRDATLKAQEDSVPVDYFSGHDQYQSCAEQFKDALHDFLQAHTVRDPQEP